MIADPEAQVSRRLFALTKGALDAAALPCGPYLAPEDAMASMDMFRIERLAEFWTNADGNATGDDLPSRIEDVICGLSGSETPWGFVVRGSERGVSCGYGVGDVAQARTIESALTGAVVSAGWNPLADHWHPVRGKTLVLTGVPSAKKIISND